LKNKKKQQTYVPNSTKKPEDEKKQLDLPASENEAFPSLCQTTEFKSTAFSYADILKKKEQQQQSEQQ
jgi:hypothetical protein